MIGRLFVVLFCVGPLVGLAWVGGTMGASRDVMHWSTLQTLPPPPVQGKVSDGKRFAMGSFDVVPVASYRLRARVLATKTYRGDALAPIAPIDLALGWGVMADPALVSRLRISQGGRFYRWRANGDQGIPVREIIRSSANVHIVPADASIARALGAVRPGAMVELEGRLVDLHRGRSTWRTSRRRDDTGGGACEIFLVEIVHAIE